MWEEVRWRKSSGRAWLLSDQRSPQFTRKNETFRSLFSPFVRICDGFATNAMCTNNYKVGTKLVVKPKSLFLLQIFMKNAPFTMRLTEAQVGIYGPIALPRKSDGLRDRELTVGTGGEYGAQ